MTKVQQSETTSHPNTDVSSKFEWLYIIFSFWFLTGIYWDAWAHTHIPENESFFTIYHLVMYTGAAGLSGLIIYQMSLNYALTGSLSTTIPRGYGPAFGGFLVFMVGGAGDLAWHELFGIEQDLEASFSPTHMLLMLGIQLFLVAPFYASWIRGKPSSTSSFVDQIPKILSFSFLLSGLMVISQWAHPLVVIYATQAGGFASEAVGMLSFFVQTVLLMGVLLLAVKEEMLPPGSYTLALFINTFALTLMRDHFEFLPIALITGITVDLLVLRDLAQRTRVRLVALLTPLLYFGLYFAILARTATIIWSIHLVTGAVAISIAVSLLVSMLILPPERSGPQNEG